MMRRVRSVIIWALVFALVIRILWWTLEPVIPLLIVTLLVVLAVGTVWFRNKQW